MKTKTSRRYKNQRGVLRREAMPQNCRVIADLVIALGLTIAWTSTALSQTKSETLKSIDAAILQSTDPITYHVNFENFNKYEGRIDVTSNDIWRVIRFNDVPSKVSLVYPTSRNSIVTQQWYPFQKKFPFVVSFEKTVQLPIEISYELSTVKLPPQGRLRFEDAEVYVRNPSNVDKPQFAPAKIKFESATPAASATASGTPAVTSSRGISSPATTEDQLFPGVPNWVILAIGGGLLLFMVLLAASTTIISVFKRLFRRESTPPRGHAKNTPPPYVELDEIRSDLKVVRPEPGHRLLGFIPWPSGSGKKARKREEKMWDGVEGTQYPTKPPLPPVNEAPKSDVVAQTPTSPTGAATPPPQTRRPQEGISPSSRDEQPVDRETGERLKTIEASHKSLQQAQWSLADRLQDTEKELRHDVEKKINALREELKNHLKEESTVFLGDLGKQQEQLNKAEESLDNARKYMQSQVEYFQKTVDRLLAEAKQKETEQHNRYSKLLGEVLGFSVETLRQGEFDAIVNEAGIRLDRFLSEQPAKVDGLSDLYRKAQAINGEIQTTLEKVRQLKPELGKLETYAERAKGLANDLKNASSLQGKPQNLKVTLDLPVGKSTQGRAIFLENLGQAIKEQIDRLHDPHAFWSKELDDFATSDIVALADICDVEVTGRPGSNPELERSLCELFRQAGLTAIVPTVGDPFKPGEQHLIEMVPGPPANSQKIKRVVKRGFYYTINAKEQLIRKAGVDVFR
jgi:hypothetical protein